MPRSRQTLTFGLLTPKVEHFMPFPLEPLVPTGITILVTDERTDGRTDGRTNREHNASACPSDLAQTLLKFN